MYWKKQNKARPRQAMQRPLLMYFYSFFKIIMNNLKDIQNKM